MAAPPVILSIAGYDPSSGAGITADVKTAAAHGCYAVTCVTALTVQSTQGVFGVQPIDADIVARTLKTLMRDLDIAAVRIGMLGSGGVADKVAEFLKSRRPPNVVIDPVLRSSSGTPLLDDQGLSVLGQMMSFCDVVTPNIAEAAILTGSEPMADNLDWEVALPELRRLAAGLHDLHAKGVVITGGHLQPANDYLSSKGPDGIHEEAIPGTKIDSRSTHGTGCAYATALACQLALGKTLPQAARAAKQYVQRAIATAYPLGKGIGPINHAG